jgi:hypothetical protein
LEVSGQLYGSAALHPRREPPVPIGYEAEAEAAASQVLEPEDVKKRQFLTSLELEIRSSGAAGRYTNCTIPTYTVRSEPLYTSIILITFRL